MLVLALGVGSLEGNGHGLGYPTVSPQPPLVNISGFDICLFKYLMIINFKNKNVKHYI